MAKKDKAVGPMSVLAATQLTGLTNHQLLKLVIVGRIRAIAEPGMRMTLNREDVERLASERNGDPK